MFSMGVEFDGVTPKPLHDTDLIDKELRLRISLRGTHMSVG